MRGQGEIHTLAAAGALGFRPYAPGVDGALVAPASAARIRLVARVEEADEECSEVAGASLSAE